MSNIRFSKFRKRALDEDPLTEDAIAKLPPLGDTDSSLKIYYETGNRPDRIRVVDDEGMFMDVLVLGDKHIGLQFVPMTPDYTQPISYFKSFEQAQDALDLIMPEWSWYSDVNIAANPPDEKLDYDLSTLDMREPGDSKFEKTPPDEVPSWVEARGSMGSALLILASAVVRL